MSIILPYATKVGAYEGGSCHESIRIDKGSRVVRCIIALLKGSVSQNFDLGLSFDFIIFPLNNIK